MPHPPECVQWEYDESPNIGLLDGRCIKIAAKLKDDASYRSNCLDDTRPVHGEMFKDLTPQKMEYLAGYYRGASFPCLIERPVFIAGKEGTPASMVEMVMDHFHDALKEDFDLLEEAKKTTTISQEEFDFLLVELLTNNMVLFLSYHPFANGNGHMGRMFLWAGLAKYGLWPRGWSLNRRPKWDDLIKRHRNGQPEGLVRFVLKAIH